VKKAHGLIASIMKGLVREGNPDPKRVIKIIQPGDPELLRPYIVGTPEEALLMPMNERFLGSVIGEASLVLRPWSMLPRDGTFSLRKWVREGDPGCLFISYKDSQMSLLSPLIGGWMGIVVKEVLDLTPDFNRRIWVVADELDSLGQVAYLKNANTRGRKFGLCVSGAIQSIAQLESTYGILGAQTLLSTFSSKIIFRQGSFKDAEYWSNELGQREIIEESKTLSESALTTAQTKKVVQTVMPSEFSGLPDLVAYCRFPGMEDIHRIEFEIRKYKSI
jgi:type IV secretory pathway TraG/TraD family ATPase VirD4